MTIPGRPRPTNVAKDEIRRKKMKPSCLQSKNLTRPGHRKTVKLEAVGLISVGDLCIQVCGQIDDGYSVDYGFLVSSYSILRQQL